jgi:RimJ/RimL family protein N-acetyltransferase
MREVGPLGGRTLIGRFVALEPLELRHHDGLIAAGADPSIWTYLQHDLAKEPELFFDWLTGENAQGQMITYAVRRLSDEVLVGSTSYLAISREHARVEVGATWYTPSAQATAVNPEAKYLLLGNAFGANYNRVELKTDARNARSRAAMKKMGATEEGTLRGHMWMPQGYFRDSVYFSILANEWPDVKAKLEARLAALN